MIESILPNLFLGIAANRLDQHVVQATLERVRGDLTIDKTLRAAWRSAADELFGSFRATQGYVQLPATEKALVDARLAWIKEDQTFEQVFRIQSENSSAFLLQDPAAVFLAEDERARNEVFATLERLGIVDGLPGGLASILQRGFIVQLRVQIIKAVILENESVRDTAIFQQFVALRRTLGDSTQQSEQAWLEARARFEAYAQDQSIALTTIAQQLDRIVAHMGIGGALPPIPSIQGFDPLTGGLSVLPGAILTKVERFLVEYLGLPASPVPFGGRTEEIVALDRWLADPAKPYALLVAPTGRGKSALVTRWTHAVAREDRAKVAFLPVSVRFDTARPEVAFGILGARLRHILSSADGASYLHASLWLREIDAYLRDGRPQDQPLLVVIDGVDEAEDWSLGRDLVIPPAAISGLKVLVSARPLPDDVEDSWPNRLDWKASDVQRLEVPTLSRAAVHQLLLEDVPSRLGPGEAEPFVSEVYRLSGGDPILVKLYVQLLSDRANDGLPLPVEELQTIEPGLAGYFRREWEASVQQWREDDPRQDSVAHALLNVFSCARGPLTKHDLLALTKPEEGSSLRIKRALASQRRLVIGDATAGYIFGHPRFGQFIREELLTAEEAQEWETRITDYGRNIAARLNAGELPPTSVPRYVLEHHANHLASAGGAPTELFALISKPWLQAWEEYSGTYDGFLGDLYCAWDAADALGSNAITHRPSQGRDFDKAARMQIRAALLASSVRGLVGSIPSELLRQLVEIGRWSPLQGIAYASAMPTDPLRKAALCALVELEIALPSRAVLETIGSIRDPRTRVEALASVLPRLDDVWVDQASSEALALVSEFGDPRERAEALVAVVPVLPDVHTKQALMLGESSRSGYDRVRILAAVAARRRGHTKVRLIKEALSEAADLDDGLKALALQILSPQLTPTTIPVALALAEGIDSPRDRAQALLALLPRLPSKSRKNSIAHIEQVLSDLTSDERIELLAELVYWIDVADQPRVLQRISAEAQTATQPWAVRQAIFITAQFFVLSGHADEALELVNSELGHSLPEFSKAEVLVDLSAVFHASDHGKLIGACREAIAATESPEREALFYADLAVQVPESFRESMTTSALAAARRVRSGRERARYLALVAKVLPISQRSVVLDEALESARKVGDSWHLDSAMALTHLLKNADSTDRQGLLGFALRVLQRISGHLQRSYVISQVLPYIESEDSCRRFAEEALDALAAAAVGVSVTASGERIPNRFMDVSWERDRTDILIALIPFLDGRLSQEALSLARSITYPGFTAELLAAMGTRLTSKERRTVLDEALALVPQETEVSRGHAYGILFGVVDPDLQASVIAAIEELADPRERAIGYAGIIEHASEGDKIEFESLACQAIADVERPHDQYRSLMHLASLVPEYRRNSIHQLAAGAASRIPEHWERMVRVSDIATAVSGEAKSICANTAIQAAHSLRTINGRWRAFTVLTCRLMELGMADLAAALAQEIEDEREIPIAQVCLDVRLEQAFDIDEALSTCAAISSPNLRAELLLTVAEHAPSLRRKDCVEQALLAALMIPKDHERQFILELLMRQLARLADTDRYVLWTRMLRELGAGDRSQFLRNLVILSPMLENSRIDPSLMAIAEAITESDDWFSEGL